MIKFELSNWCEDDENLVYVFKSSSDLEEFYKKIFDEKERVIICYEDDEYGEVSEIIEPENLIKKINNEQIILLGDNSNKEDD